MNDKRPIAVVINGKGGCGKDSLIRIVQEKLKGKYRIENVSAIDPIKKIMLMTTPWDGIRKTDADRAFMHDLKMIYVRYCDMPNQYLLECYDKAVEAGTDVIFMHIREPEEIRKLVESMKAKHNTVLTLLIHRPEVENRVYGNDADDDVNKYDYDIDFLNEGSLEESGARFVQKINDIIERRKDNA